MKQREKIPQNKPEMETEDEDEGIEVITMTLTEALLSRLKPKLCLPFLPSSLVLLFHPLAMSPQQVGWIKPT